MMTHRNILTITLLAGCMATVACAGDDGVVEHEEAAFQTHAIHGAVSPGEQPETDTAIRAEGARTESALLPTPSTWGFAQWLMDACAQLFASGATLHEQHDIDGFIPPCPIDDPTRKKEKRD